MDQQRQRRDAGELTIATTDFIPFALPDITEREVEAVSTAMRSGWLTTGPNAAAFEDEFAAFLGGDGIEAIAANSATAGLHLAIESLGIGPGDEVLVPTWTFTSTAEVVRYVGATPILVDVNPVTLNIDLDAAGRAVTPRTRAIMPVHFAGLPVSRRALSEFAGKHGVAVIEDAAHAFPVRNEGRYVGDSESDAVVFSFYATKTITTGEGGMIVTRNPEVAKRARTMRLHGISRDIFDRYTSTKPSWRYEVVAPGFKYNLTDTAAAMGRVQLARANKMRAARESIAVRYNEGIGRSASRTPHPPLRARGSRLAPLRDSSGRRCPAHAGSVHRGDGNGGRRHECPLHPAPSAPILAGYLRPAPRRLPHRVRRLHTCGELACLLRDDRRAGGPSYRHSPLAPERLMVGNMRIGIFTQWYAPEPGPAAVVAVTARALAARGHEVHVLTGFPNYPTGTVLEGYRQSPLMHEDLDGVHVTRVPLYPSHDQSAVRRFASYASFGVSAAMLGVPSLPPLDVLWVNYSPITLALPMWLQQLMRGTPTVCEVADLWPDTLDVAGLSGAGTVSRVAKKWLDRWCGAMYASSDAVVYISPSVGEILTSRGVPPQRLHYIPKSADEQVFRPGGNSLRSELGIHPDAVVLSYAGAMGTAQGLDSLVDACALVADARLVVLLAGSGTRESELRERASSRGQSNVRFLGRIPQRQMTDLLATSDLAYVSLAEHALSAATMPSKTQSILAAGRPILVSADGDVADLIESHSVGFAARSRQPDEIAEMIRTALVTGRSGLDEMGRQARELYLSEFSVEKTTRQAEELMASIAGRQRKVLRRSAVLPPPRSRTTTVDYGLAKSDAEELARLHQTAFPTYFLSQLGVPFLKQFYLGFLDDPTAIVAVARDDTGQPRGVVVGTTEPIGFFSRLLRRRLAGFVGASALATLKNPRVAPRLIAAVTYRGDNPPGQQGALLSSICVDPAWAGQGVGSDLLHSWRQRATAMGVNVAFLTTDSTNNESVNRFYMRDGWALNDTFTTHEGRRMNRYVRELSESPLEATAIGGAEMNHSSPLENSPTIVPERSLDVFRLRDVLGASAGLALCAPLFAALAVAIRADSPGPVFFRQQRVGRHGKLFSIHKFRTMQAANDGLAVSVSNDPRITRVGRILRATKVDELPQLIDVLRGDMALVGPRPEVPIYAGLWPADLRPLILSVRPGITDPATVALRHEAVVLARSTDPERTYVEEFLPRKAHEYSVYVRNRTFIGDLRILIDTLRAVFSPPTHQTHSQLMNVKRGGKSR